MGDLSLSSPPPEEINFDCEIQQQLQKMGKEITSHTEQVTKALTNTFQEQQKEVVRHVDKQLEYLKAQFNASLGWRLKHHHTELLKDLFSVLTPMSDAATRLQDELSHCKTIIHSVSVEITSAKAATTFGQEAFKERVVSSLFTPVDEFFTAMADHGAFE